MNSPIKRENLSLNKSEKAPRARFHDYCKPGCYLITITTYPGRPILSRIPDPGDAALRLTNMIIPQNTELGECVRQELIRIPEKDLRIRLRRYVIMPDHIHFVLSVTEELDRPIGKYIAPFTAACSKAHSRLAALPSVVTLFKPFDDSIIFDSIQFKRAIKYVEDNPRRYILRRRYPDLFNRNMHLCVGDHEYAAYGNLFLLKSIRLMPVRIHRRWSPDQFKAYREECLAAIEDGAVPISPAIHKAEKEIIEEAIRRGSPLILLRDLSFGERFKPQGKYFDLCADGRLLLLSPWPDNIARTSRAGYAEFHTMNDHAKAIADLPAESRLVIRKIH